jgi:N-acetylglucosaminyl-diphospho-decaprenol L-rhamnosyltransferase
MGSRGRGHDRDLPAGAGVTAVTAIVVNYDGGQDVLDCLKSLQESSSPPDVVVVDNASTDGSPDRIEREYPHVRLVRNARNTGFGAGVNAGARAATTPYLVLVNQDSAPDPAAIETLAAALDERPRAGAVGALVLNPDGSVQPSKRSFPSIPDAAMHGILGLFWKANPGSRSYLLASERLDEPTRVDWVSANSMALRKEAFDAVGGFDEGYFFFVEDVDLCKRLADAGWEVWFEPLARFVHAWGTSWTKRPMRFLWMHHANLFRYVRKHRRGAWILAWPLVGAGLLLRFVLLAVRLLLTGRAVPAHSQDRRPKL